MSEIRSAHGGRQRGRSRTNLRATLAASLLVLCAIAGAGRGLAGETGSEAEAAGSVGRLESARLPAIGDHFVWVVDAVFGHSQLFDGDTGKMYATIDGGTTLSPKPPVHAPGRGEFYSVEIDYDRGKRGQRTDYVTIHDAKTLEVKGDIVFPTRAGESAASLAYSALLDGERFLAVFNQFPVTSVSIIDLESRVFVGEIPGAGCAGIYPTGPRSYAMLCGSGTMHHFMLGEDGSLDRDVASERFFDPIDDPVMLAGGRIGKKWFFPSFLGHVAEVDFSQEKPAADSWPMASDAERDAGWRPGGRQLAAANRALSRFYVLFHRGGPGSHKAPGPELWVFDTATRERVGRFAMPNFTASFLADMTGMGTEGFGPWLLGAVLPDDGADTVTVSHDAEPLVFVRHSERGAVAVIDGQTGEHLRNLTEVGLGGTRLEVP